MIFWRLRHKCLFPRQVCFDASRALLRTKRCAGDCSPSRRGDGFTHAGTAWGVRKRADRGRTAQAPVWVWCACGYAHAALVERAAVAWRRVTDGHNGAGRASRSGTGRGHVPVYCMYVCMYLLVYGVGEGPGLRKDVPKHQATVSLLGHRATDGPSVPQIDGGWWTERRYFEPQQCKLGVVRRKRKRVCRSMRKSSRAVGSGK